MDTESEIREFLTTRRARITPEQAGLRTYGTGPRRVPGLRREEVALLAGSQLDYYTSSSAAIPPASPTPSWKRSRAPCSSTSPSARTCSISRAPAHDRRPGLAADARRQQIRPGVQRLLDAISAPAFVRNGRMDILGANELGRALYSEMFDNPRRPANSARFAFLDPRATTFFVDWDQAADDSVAVLRAEAGRNPYDRDLTDLVGELSTQSEEFRVRWARHDVRYHDTGVKRIHHPVVGDARARPTR